MLSHDEGLTIGVYAWRQRQANPTPRMLADAELGELIGKIHDQSYGTYGGLRVTAELRLGLGRQVNHKRVQRLMRERGLQGVTRRRRSKRCVTDPAVSDDLVHRQFRPDRPNRLWIQDIERHEALSNRAVVKGHGHRLVAACRLKLRAA